MGPLSLSLMYACIYVRPFITYALSLHYIHAREQRRTTKLA